MKRVPSTISHLHQLLPDQGIESAELTIRKDHVNILSFRNLVLVVSVNIGGSSWGSGGGVERGSEGSVPGGSGRRGTSRVGS